jgi:phosphatidylinositol-bisphosphatase
VAISGDFLGHSFCFINSHLPARQERLINRNHDYAGLSADLMRAASDVSKQFSEVFWCGDLNYRIDSTRDEIYKKVAVNDWDSLLSSDQLTRERRADRTFCEYQEGKIHL